MFELFKDANFERRQRVYNEGFVVGWAWESNLYTFFDLLALVFG